MSGVVKGVKKVFKKVVKVAKKVAPIALAVGAIYFTAGAALGIPGTAGGWGAAVSKLTQNLGATGMLGRVLTGAVTQAGYGAVLGGGLSLVSGNDPLKGAQYGAAGGALTGGLLGAADINTDPFKGIGENPAASETAAKVGPQANPDLTIETTPGTELAPNGMGFRQIPLDAATASAPAAATTVSSGVAAPEESNGLLSFINKNQVLAGGAIAGLGQGVGALAGASTEAEALEKTAKLKAEAEKARQDRIAGNYGSSGGLLKPGTIPIGQPRPTPSQRYDPATYGGRYVFDPSIGQIVLVRNA